MPSSAGRRVWRRNSMPELVKGGHRDLEKFYNLMEVDFDSEELLGKLRLHKALSDGSAELLIMKDTESGMELAYAVVFPKSVYGYVLLKYFGVLPWYRGNGVGIDAMRLLNRRYCEKQGIIAEITDFPDSDPDHQKKLKKFFSRFGYENIDVNYKISGTDAHIYVKPLKNKDEIQPVIHRIIRDFYSRVMSPAEYARKIDIEKAATK